MRALYIHISGLAGLLVFLKEVLNYAPIERTILVAATTGLTVYLMLVVGHSIVQRIMAYSPPTSSSNPDETYDVQQHAAMQAPMPPPGEVPAGAEPDPLAAEANADVNAPPSLDAPDGAPPNTDTAPSSAEPDTSAPDRAAASDRSETEPSEPVPQTPA